MIKNPKVYDTLKGIVMYLVPAMEFLVLSLGEIWDIPYYAKVGASIAAVGTFIAILLGISTYKYNNEYGEILGEAQHRIAEMQDDYVGEIFEDEEFEDDEFEDDEFEGGEVNE